MAPKKRSPESDPKGMFAGMVVFLVEAGVQPRRLQIWKQKLEQMGAEIDGKLSKKVTHVFAANSETLIQQIGRDRLSRFKGSILLYQWLEDSLSLGEKASDLPYVLTLESDRGVQGEKSPDKDDPRVSNANEYNENGASRNKKSRTSPQTQDAKTASKKDIEERTNRKHEKTVDDSGGSFPNQSSVNRNSRSPDASPPTNLAGISNLSLQCSPPDQNQNITKIFGKLVNIYRALGDDRRSFSYYKAIAVIEKLPFKIESVDQVKHLPAIGKSMQDHIQEIVSTGRLSKLDHFETDEKVRTITLFGEVWGIGPATALKLYEKGHRSLDDLKNDDSLTNSQMLGLKYFEDIRTRIPRHEVQEMELLLRRAAEEVLPGVLVVCGGSYRRGKATCGDMDIVITHPDGKSHKGFLRKYVQHLKDMEFLREDLIFSIHSEDSSDSGVDTYFGLCTYPGRELRHRIDLKVYPRDIYAFGLIAWTGNDVLNRRLRILADAKGYRLDDTGLFPATQGARATASLHFQTERQVFEFLDFPWLEPHERNL